MDWRIFKGFSNRDDFVIDSVNSAGPRLLWARDAEAEGCEAGRLAPAALSPRCSACQKSGLLGEMFALQDLSSKAGAVAKSPPSHRLSSSFSARGCGFDPAQEDGAEGERPDRDGVTTGLSGDNVQWHCSASPRGGHDLLTCAVVPWPVASKRAREWRENQTPTPHSEPRL